MTMNTFAGEFLFTHLRVDRSYGEPSQDDFRAKKFYYEVMIKQNDGTLFYIGRVRANKITSILYPIRNKPGFMTTKRIQNDPEEGQF